MKPDWVVCIAKPIGQGKRCFTEIGVAWSTLGGGIKISIDLTIVLGPNDEMYLFKKDKVK